MSLLYQHIPALDNPFLDSMQWGQLVKTLEQMLWSLENKPMSGASRAKLKQSILEAQQNIRKRVTLAYTTPDPDFWDKMRGAECYIVGTSLEGSILGSEKDGKGIQVQIIREKTEPVPQPYSFVYSALDLRIRVHHALLRGV